jgi:hypothetical protein
MVPRVKERQAVLGSPGWLSQVAEALLDLSGGGQLYWRGPEPPVIQVPE